MSGAYALIPARGGSKGVPKKNIKLLGGFPLIGYSIAACLLSETVERIIVSTDSDEIAEVAASLGAEVPFRRPAELASDSATDTGVLRHALAWLRHNEGIVPELVVKIRPTTPLREPRLIDEAVRLVANTPAATSLRSAHALPEPPQKMLGIDSGYFVGLFPADPRPDYWNLPRQSFPPAFHPNGYVDILRASIIESGAASMHGDRILAFVTPHAVEVDTSDDFDYLEYLIAKREHPLQAKLRSITQPHRRRQKG